MVASEAVESGFEKFLTAEEAAAELEKLGIVVSPLTLGERRRTGKVPGHKVNGRVRFHLSELLRYYSAAARPEAKPEKKKH